MYGYIYKTTNTYNGKIYIGQHRSNKFNAEYLGSGVRLNNVINKYGKSAFTCELLEECSSEQELNEKEIYWIDKLKATDKNVGYNLMPGGYKIRGIIHSEYSRQKISNTLKHYYLSHYNPKKGTHLTEQTKEKLRKANLGKKMSKECIEKHKNKTPWNKGKHLTEAQKEHLRQINLGKKTIQKNSHTIYQMDFKGNVIASYPTLRQASLETGFSAICIRRVCEGIRNQSHGYIWRYDNPIM